MLYTEGEPLLIPRKVSVPGTCNEEEAEVLWVIQQREDEKQRWEGREEERKKKGMFVQGGAAKDRSPGLPSSLNFK